MENNTYLVGNSFNWETARVIEVGVAGSPYLAAGFLLGYVLLGLASFNWAFWSQRSGLRVFKKSVILYFSCQHGSLRGIQNTHNSLFVLLLMDVLNAITAIILAILLAASTCGTALNCVYIFTAWLVLRILGMVFHLLSASASVFFLCHPQPETRQRYYLLPMVVVSFISAIACFLNQDLIIALGSCSLTFVVVIIVICIKFTPVSPSAAAGRKQIVLVAMFTVLFAYEPVFVLQCLIFNSGFNGEATDKYLIIYANVLFCTNFQLFMDGLLCFLNLKLTAGEEEEQQQQQQQQLGFNNPDYGFSGITNS